MVLGIPGLFLVLLSGQPANSQSAALRAPASGLLYDAPSRSLRTLIGIPGSSYLGKAALGDLDNAFVAPNGQAAVVVEKGQAVLIQGFGDEQLTGVPLQGLTGPVTAVAWASNSMSLVAYSPSSRSLHRVDLRSATPAPEPAVDLSHLEGDVVEIVSTGEDSLTILAVRHPEKGGLYALKSGALTLMMSTASNPGPAVFHAVESILYAIDPVTRRMLRFSDGIHANPATLTFAGETEPLADPVGLAFSQDGRRAFVAGGLDRAIREYDLRSLTLLREIPVEVSPQRLTRIAPFPSVFTLAARGSNEQPLWLLDTKDGRPVSFAPANQ